MHAAAREEIGIVPGLFGVLEVVALGELEEIAGVVELPGTASGFESSFFHILTPRHRKLDFRSRLSQGWLELRLGRVNIVHDLTAVNKNGGWQIWGVAQKAIPLIADSVLPIPLWIAFCRLWPFFPQAPKPSRTSPQSLQ